MPAPSPEDEHPESLLIVYLDSKRKVYPAHYNRASAIGHPCERHLVYMRTAWEEASPPDIRLQGIFEFGKDFEHMLRKKLTEAGYMFRVPYRPTVWHNLQLSGTNDGDVSWDGGKTWHMVEIKGLHPYFWTKVNRWQDFLEMGVIYSKYPAQCQVYMLLENIDQMYFVLGCKGTYDVKWLPIGLEYDYAESLLAKLERVNKHVAAGTLPDKLNDLDVCDLCEYRDYCLPDVFYGDGALIADDPKAVALLDERAALAVEKSRIDGAYKRVNERIKRMLGDAKVALIGDYQIAQKPVKKRAQPATEYSLMKIRKLSERTTVEEGAGDDLPAV